MKTIEKDAPRKRALKGLGWFFIVMIALTVCAKTLRTLSIAQVETARPQRSSLVREYTGKGKVVAGSQRPLAVDAAFKEYGLLVDSVEVSVGQRVQQGDVLLHLNIDRLSSALDAAKAKQEKEIRQAQTLLSEAEEALLTAQRDLDAKSLEKVRALEDALRASESAQTAFAAARGDAKLKKEYEAAQIKLQRAREDQGIAQQTGDGAAKEAARKLERAEENWNAAKAEGAAAISRLERLVKQGGAMTAPEAGTITATQVEAGEALGDVIVQWAPEGGALWVKCRASRKALDAFQTGDAAFVNLGSGDVSSALSGKLDVAEKPDQVDILASAEGLGAAFGDEASLRLYRETPPYDFVVPLCAIKQDSQGTFVYVMARAEDGEGHTAARRDVRLIDRDAQSAAVQGSIGSDARIITASNKPIGDGDSVQEAREP